MKRKLVTLSRIFKGGITNFIRNAWLAAAAIAVMVITLTVVLFSVIANATFVNTIKQLTDRIDISVYLKDDITNQRKDELIEQLKAKPEVKNVEYISKDDALKRYRKKYENDIDQLMAISQADNPLPASLIIKPTDPNNLEPIRQFLETEEIKVLQSYPTSYSSSRKVAIDRITQATSFFSKAGIVGVVVFATISMLIIFNTIRMAIFNRREELNIMRLLGASTWYIRGPFVIETMLYGIIAAIISVALCNALFAVSSSALGASSLGLLDISYANNFFVKNFWLILASQLAIGILIGGVSSYIATRRYLKFKSSK